VHRRLRVGATHAYAGIPLTHRDYSTTLEFLYPSGSPQGFSKRGITSKESGTHFKKRVTKFKGRVDFLYIRPAQNFGGKPMNFENNGPPPPP